MTVIELFNTVKQRLEAGECDSPAFDACCLLEDVGELGRGAVAGRRNQLVEDAVCRRVLAAAERRSAGEPLQYLLGTWDFLSLTLEVGEGVLIPRPETELLCELTARHLASLTAPRVLDLCAGSGCVGLGIASLCPSASVVAVEKSPDAFRFLERNVARYPQWQVTPVCADILTDPVIDGERFDAIVSNPPYIPAAELPSLQREVHREPRMALDGGEDGLLFYRAITERWVPLLRPGGMLAVEVGIGQDSAVAQLFRDAGLSEVRATSDYANIPRIICGFLNNNTFF